MNNKLILWSITVGLGGLLFGLDTAVISGAEQVIEKLWSLTKEQHGLAMAIALYGTVLGAAFGGLIADKLGRKKTLLWVGILFFISSIGAAVAGDVNTFMVFRFIGGLSIGASSVVAPVYISEIAPPQYRGRMVISFQMNIVLGILLAYVSNYLLQGSGDNDWRWMLGIVAVPSLLFSILILFTPETPRWLLLRQHNEAAARSVLSITSTPEEVEAEIVSIKTAAETEAKKNSNDSLFSKKYTRPLLLAFLLAFFNQASGINAVIYFAPRIFEMAGFSANSSLLTTAGIGVVNMVFTILGWSLIDKFGRRILLYIGSIGYIVSLGLIAYSFYSNQTGLLPIYVFAFIASHAVGQGAIIWVYISEIFPNSVRASGMAFGSLTHWVFAAILTNVFPILAQSYGPAIIFAFFSAMMVLQLLYTAFMMPETRGVSLEDLQKKLTQE